MTFQWFSQSQAMWFLNQSGLRTAACLLNIIATYSSLAKTLNMGQPYNVSELKAQFSRSISVDQTLRLNSSEFSLNSTEQIDLIRQNSIYTMESNLNFCS